MVRIWIALLLAMLGIGSVQATTLYRLPLAYIPYPINAWFDHSSASGVDTRYDGTNIPSTSTYYYDGHRGTDFGVSTGTAVYLAASGTVLAIQTGCQVGDASCGAGFGNYVAVIHADNMVSIYAHLSSVTAPLASLVCVSGPGGNLIGYSGDTGFSTGPHLHFELRENNLLASSTSHDPFGGVYGPMYWYDWADVYDPLKGVPYVMPYPVTTCQ